MTKVYLRMLAVSDLLRIEPAGLEPVMSERYRSLSLPKDRHRFLGRRMAIAALRRDLGLPAIDLPDSGGPPGGCSVSSSMDTILVAQADDPFLPIGVDLEVSRRWPEAAAILGGTPGEAAQAWVRLEAIAKATGRGLPAMLGAHGSDVREASLAVWDLEVPDARAALASRPGTELVWVC